MTRGALYHHFASKEDLFRAVYETVERDLAERIAATTLAAPICAMNGTVKPK